MVGDACGPGFPFIRAQALGAGRYPLQSLSRSRYHIHHTKYGSHLQLYLKKVYHLYQLYQLLRMASWYTCLMVFENDLLLLISSYFYIQPIRFFQ